MMWDFSGGRRSPQPRPPPIRMPSPSAMPFGQSAPGSGSSYPPLPLYGTTLPTPQTSGSDAYPSPWDLSRGPSRPQYAQHSSSQEHHVVLHHSKHHTKTSHHHRERRHSHTVAISQSQVPQVPIYTSQSYSQTYSKPTITFPPLSFEKPPKKLSKPSGSGSKPAAKPSSSKPQRDEDCYSRCTGRRKALCIGINYKGQENELRGCINDAKRVREFLIKHGGYRPENILMLTDDAQNPGYLPTKKNIEAGMKWLVKNAHTDDALFFHYSGHGGQTRDLDGDEVDGWDEGRYIPTDFRKSGHILDDDMHKMMVEPLPKRCRLTACHSGTYSSHGRLKGSHVSSRARREKESRADVISWSGCKDGQTSADTFHELLLELTVALASQPNQSYQELLRSIRRILHPRFSQKPQLGSSHHINTNLKFVF
ncbi:casa protein [Coprinopsis sp. MPI-PUGE-AT-0042]|nr:casa protein [Coprinopsis sp. MPI-PUGE-AT-0042]